MENDYLFNINVAFFCVEKQQVFMTIVQTKDIFTALFEALKEYGIDAMHPEEDNPFFSAGMSYVEYCCLNYGITEVKFIKVMTNKNTLETSIF